MVALAVVLVLLLALLWGISSAVRALTGSDAQPEAADSGAAQVEQSPTPTVDPDNKFAGFTPRPSHSPSGGPSAEPTESKAPAAQCGTDLAVTAATDKNSYADKQEPVLILSFENTGKNPCRVNAGTKAMTYVVDTGGDTVFDSRHCAAPGDDREMTLDPGKKEEARLPWNRVRTAEGCPAGQPDAPAGYYNLTASLGDQSSASVPFTLE